MTKNEPLKRMRGKTAARKYMRENVLVNYQRKREGKHAFAIPMRSPPTIFLIKFEKKREERHHIIICFW